MCCTGEVGSGRKQQSLDSFFDAVQEEGFVSCSRMLGTGKCRSVQSVHVVSEDFRRSRVNFFVSVQLPMEHLT